MPSFIRKFFGNIIGFILDITFTNGNVITGIKPKSERNDKARTNKQRPERNRIKEVTDK